jgi:molybdate transport system substrate-binding protein
MRQPADGDGVKGIDAGSHAGGFGTAAAGLQAPLVDSIGPARLCGGMMRCLLLLLALLTAPLLAAPARAEVPQVAAAADLRLALPALAAAFEQASGAKVALRFAASGVLAQQLRNGAPDTLFLSADAALAGALAADGLTLGPPRAYALGRLALVSPRSAPLADLAALGRALQAGQVQHLAIANPLTAPYGARAQEALFAAGILPGQQGRLVRGDNVAQALQFVVSGGAEAGLVSAALVHDGSTGLNVALVPARLHGPLVQQLVLMQGAGPVAQRFAAFILSPTGQAVLARFGFQRP